MAGAAGLQFNIGASIAPLEAALIQAEQVAKAGSAKISSAFASAGDGLLSALLAARENMNAIATAINTAIDSGAGGVEKSVVNGIEGAKTAAMGYADSLEKELSSKLGKAGKVLDLIWENSKTTLASTLNDWSAQLATFAQTKFIDSGSVTEFKKALVDSHLQYKSFGEYASEMLANFKNGWSSANGAISGVSAALSGGFSTSMQRSEKEMQAAAGAAAEFAKKIDGVIAGLSNAVGVLAGTRMDAASFTGITDELEKQINLRKMNLELIGKSSAEQAEIRAKRTIDDLAGKADNPLDDDQQKTVNDKLGELKASVAAEEGAKAAIKQADQIKNILIMLERQVDMQSAATLEAGRTAGEIARARAEAQINATVTRENLRMTDEQVDRETDLLHLLEQQADVRAKGQFDRQLDQAGRSAVSGQFDALDALGKSAGAVAQARFEMAEYNKLVNQGIPVTSEITARIHGWGDALRTATDAADQAKAHMAQLNEAGQVVSNTFASAFSSWTKGAKLDFQSMTEAMLRNLEQLAFKMAVLQPLFGGGASGGGLIGQLGASLFGGSGGGIGPFTTTVMPEIAGARALGGPVLAGKTYQVNEHGQEFFTPSVSGTIVPASAMGNGGDRMAAPNIAVNIVAPPGSQVTKQEQRDDGQGGFSMDILIEQIEAKMATNVSDGRSPIGQAMAFQYGLNPAAGAR
ncbi:MAG: phage tail tape measure C-terminal domain-containing protein [Hyphomicrobiaceae bacterium]